MSNIGTQIPRKNPGDPVTAAEWNRLVDQVNQILRVSGDNYIAAQITGGALQVRWTGPPIGPIGVRIPAQLTAAGTNPGQYQWKEMQWDYPTQTWNPLAGGRTHADLGEAYEVNLTASLPTGDSSPIVYLAPSRDLRTDTDGQVWEFTVSSKPASTGLTMFRITGSTQVVVSTVAQKKWIYTAKQLKKNTAGYGGWGDIDGATNQTLYNSIEDQNGATGNFGNGVNSGNLTGTFTIKPIPNGTRVFAQEITLGSGDKEWWIVNYANGVDGGCT